MSFIAPHNVTDPEKFAALVEMFRVGEPVPPVAACGETALTGSHRIAACDRAKRLWNDGAEGWESSPEPGLDSVQISDADYLAACDLLGIAHHDELASDLSKFVAALWCVTEDADLKACLADQRNEYADETAESLVG